MWQVATGSTYTLWGVLQEVVGKNLRIFPIMYKQFKHLAYAFFDVTVLWGETGALTVAPKDIPGIEPSITVDGVSIKRLDYNTFDFSTTTDGDQSITLAAYSASFDVADSAGFAVNDTVYIKTDWTGSDVDGTITAITDADTVVIKVATVDGVAATATNAITIKDGQEVQRWFWKRNDEDEVVRPSSDYNYTEYQSYIQHFSRRISFTKQELNKEYKYEGEAVNEATKRLNYNIGVLFQEINKAIYKGKNVAPGSGANDKMEMLGLEEIVRQVGNIADFSSSSDMLGDFYAIIEEAQQSWAVASNDTITLLVNDRFLTELGRFRDEEIRYDKVVEKLDMVIPTLATVYGNIELVRDPMLNTLYNYSVAFTMPKALIKLWTRENQSFEPKGGISKSDQSIRFYTVLNNIREKDSYDMVRECGMIAWGMSATQSPYHMIKKFAAD